MPSTLKIGGHDFSIVSGGEVDKELEGNGNAGSCSTSRKRISLKSTLLPQAFSEIFIHEVLHAIGGVFGNYTITEDEFHGLANGLLQVLEQLDIRFVLGDGGTHD